MRFFLDENFPKAALALLNREDHEVVDIRGTEKEGSGDDELFLMPHFCTSYASEKSCFEALSSLRPALNNGETSGMGWTYHLPSSSLTTIVRFSARLPL